jgi:hypothetical protein
MRKLFRLLWAAVLILAAARSSAQTSYPMITHATPIAVQRGKTTEVVIEGQMTFWGAYKVLVEGSGVTAEVSDPTPARAAAAPVPNVRTVKLKMTVAADAPLGVREFRIATNLGVSSIGQLVIVDAPVIIEKAPNNTIATATPIPVPGVVSARIEAAEDVDFWKFHAEAGQTFYFEVFCARIQDKIHDLQKHADPMLTLYDGAGRELAANDDFFFADPALTYTFARAGDYFIQVRDSKYDGDPRWAYALIVTDQPAVTHVFPMAGNPGQEVVVEPVGSAKLKQEKVVLKAPGEPGIHLVSLDLAGTKTNPVTFIVSRLPQVVEQEPKTPAQATKVTIPCGISGRIGKPRDVDHFSFHATKGKAIRFEVMARRFGTDLQSSLDSTIDILDAKGAVLASNDDAVGKDAALTFTPTVDGDYVLRVRDLNSKGGPTAVYYIECDWAVPDYTLRCDPDKAMIGPGSSTAWFVHVNRLNGFAGPVKVEVKGLPEGVTVNPLTIPATMTQGLLVVTAAANAPKGAANVQIVGTATATIDGKEQTLTRSCTPNQEIYFPGGGRGRFDVRLQTVAVTEASDILQVKVSATEIKLKPGQEVRLDVTIERRADYDKAVSLDVLLRHLGTVFGNPLPPGVTIVEGKSKTLLGTGNTGHVILKADPKAVPIDKVPISVTANVSINFVVKMSYSSPAILVTVEK